MKARSAALTATALVAFAGNSVLCRLALASRQVDAASFTALRLASGALVLALLARHRAARVAAPTTTIARWISPVALFAYAAPFSFAYLRVSTGIGALVLFGVVQSTMIAWGIARGERPSPVVWVGLAIAVAGLVALTAPGASAPDLLGVAGMAIAGASWAVYTLRGRGEAGDPVVATAANFARSVPFAAALLAAAWITRGLHATPRGVVLALVSGTVTSGLGYSVWYAALRDLTATRAAVLQLSVPVLAAVGGATVLGEQASVRLVLAGGAILGGVALALRGRETRRP